MDPEDKDLVVSYLTLRQMIGWAGLLLPFSVRLGAYLFEHIASNTVGNGCTDRSLRWSGCHVVAADPGVDDIHGRRGVERTTRQLVGPPPVGVR